MPQNTWHTAPRDTIPPTELSLSLQEVHVYLYAFLRSEHEEFTDPYEPVRANIRQVIEDNAERPRRPAQRPSATIDPARLRTWKSDLEQLGFIHVDQEQRIQVTALGRMIRDLHEDLSNKISGANDHIAALALAVLNRHVLRNPLETADYPSDTDLHPYRAIWRTARELDNRIHWEEVNRVLFKVLREEDLPTAIAQIRAVRDTSDGTYTQEQLDALGPRALEEGNQTRRRITPWLTRAGFGGTFLQKEDGFWRLVDSRLGFIDEVLATPAATPPPEAMVSSESYLEYVLSGLLISRIQPSSTDIPLLERARSAVERFGSHKVIVLSGLPSTGKTRLARILAAELTDNDPYRLEEIQFHETTTYDRFVEGFVPRTDGSGYQLRPMTLRSINERALRDPRERTYVLLIEELTRADVHSVLGELLTYIEHRDRKFRLPLSQNEMRIAPNLVVIATMNPRDRSALTLDDAILRRLHQITLEPDPTILRELIKEKLDPEIVEQLMGWYQQYAPTLPFGHGELVNATSADDLRDIWRGTLIYFLRDSVGNIRQQYQEAAAAYPWK